MTWSLCREERGVGVTCLLRWLTALGLGTGLLMVGIVWWAITNVSEERQELDGLRGELAEAMNGMRGHIEDGRRKLTMLLDVEHHEMPETEADWIQNTKTHADELARLASRLRARAQPEAVSTSLKRLQALHAECVEWRRQYQRVLPLTGVVKQELRQSLSQLREAVESAEGKQRLEEAVLHRKYRSSHEAEAEDLARESLSRIIRGPDLGSVKTELIDLALLIERLLQEDESDNLVDHKDNQLKPVLDRLHNLLVLYDGSQPAPETRLTPLLDEVMVSLFGADAQYGNTHLIIVPGTNGVYVAIHTGLSLEAERALLRVKARKAFAELDGFAAKLETAKDESIFQLAQESEAAFRRAWLTITLLCATTSVAFLILAWRIGRAIRAQVSSVEEAKREVDAQTMKLSESNASLRHEIDERKRTGDALRDSEERLRTVIQDSKDAMVAIDGDGLITLFNPAAEELFGHRKEEVLGGPLEPLMPEDIREDHRRYVEGYFAVGEPNNAIDKTVELSALRASGEVFPVELSLSAGRMGDEPFVLAVIRDITERKQTEIALRDSEARFRALAEDSHDVIMRFDRDFRHLYANPAVETQTGIPRETFIGKTHEELGFPADLTSLWEDAVKKVFQSGEPNRIEFMLPNGGWIDWYLVPERSGHGDVEAVMTSARDITELKRTEDALRESETLLRATLEATADGILVVDKDGRATHANRRFSEMWRIPPEIMASGDDEKLLAFALDQLLEPEAFTARVRALYASSDEDFDTLVFKDGRVFERFSCPLMREGSLAGRVWSFRDITQRKQAERALRESEERLALAMEATNDALWDWDVRTGNTYFSPRYYTMLGYEVNELPSGFDTWERLLHPEDRKRALQALEEHVLTQAQTFELEFRMRSKSGEWCWILSRGKVVESDDDGKALRFVGTHTDISQRKRNEEKIRQYADTQAVLLREVNHRVKNNLAAIVSMVHKEEQQATARGLANSIPLLHDLEGRVQGLLTVHSMLSQSGWRPLVLSDLCEQVIRGALQGVPPGKTVDLRVERTDIEVNSEQAHQLTLVLNELATNSVKHALHDRGAGTVRVDFVCSSVTCDCGEVCINYRDDGPGYSEEMLQGCFDDATIGFELVRGIVKRSLRGRLSIRNDGGALTTITFRQTTVPEETEDC